MTCTSNSTGSRRTLRFAALALLAACGSASAQIQIGDPVPHQFVARIVVGGDINNVALTHGLTLARQLNDDRVYLLEGFVGDDDESELAELEGDDEVESVEKNRYVGGPEGNTQSFFMSATPQLIDTQPVVPFLQIPAAWGYSDGTGITVAVLDTGVAPHPRIASRILTTGYDFILDTPGAVEVPQGVDTNGDGIVDQLFGHGTFVSGLTNLVAPGASILPVRVLDSDGVGTSFSVAAGIYHAIANGAKVINLSLSTPEKDEAIDIAIQEAEAAGVVVVASVGNDNSHAKRYPAGNTHVVSVSATAMDDVKAPFSNYGSYVEMSAPGIDLVSLMPNGGYAMASGTSFSAALVSGTAALARSAFPSETPAETRARLLSRGPSVDGVNPGYHGQLGHDRVAPLAVVQSCLADFNNDTFLDFSDFDAFVAAFEGGLATADVNFDGFLDFTDFDTFVVAFEAGC
ncbi:MAG: S8 family serine peptidase [Planctomycetota bacterium]|nr:S8 family serine peptidase [Planctomycetota bacterium]